MTHHLRLKLALSDSFTRARIPSKLTTKQHNKPPSPPTRQTQTHQQWSFHKELFPTIRLRQVIYRERRGIATRIRPFSLNFIPSVLTAYPPPQAPSKKGAQALLCASCPPHPRPLRHTPTFLRMSEYCHSSVTPRYVRVMFNKTPFISGFDNRLA
jgi:hypothetical protein